MSSTEITGLWHFCVFFWFVRKILWNTVGLDHPVFFIYKIYQALKRRLSDAFNNCNMSELKKSAVESIPCLTDWQLAEMFVSFSRMHSSAGLSAQIEIQSTQVGFMQAKQSGTENAQHVFLFVSKYAKASSGHSILLQLYTNVFIFFNILRHSDLHSVSRWERCVKTGATALSKCKMDNHGGEYKTTGGKIQTRMEKTQNHGWKYKKTNNVGNTQQWIKIQKLWPKHTERLTTTYKIQNNWEPCI